MVVSSRFETAAWEETHAYVLPTDLRRRAVLAVCWNQRAWNSVEVRTLLNALGLDANEGVKENVSDE